MFQLLLLTLFLSSNFVFGQNLELLSGSTFHDASWDSEFGDLEDTGSPDEGGQLYLILKNTLGSDLAIDSVFVQNLNGENQEFDGWYNWPDTMTSANGNLTTLFVKAINAPLAEGEDCRILVYAGGTAHTYDFNDLETPALRLANYVPNYDRNALWLYLRNDGNAAVTLDSVYFNEVGIPLAGTGQIATIYGGSTIAPNETRMINIQAGLDLTDLTPYAIRLKYNGGDWVSAGIRIVAPYFPIGSWHSSGMDPDKEYGRKRMRKVGVQTLHGPGNYQYISDSNQEYHIQVIREPGFGNPFDPTGAAAEVNSESQNEAILTWTVDDEPDLNGKSIDQQLIKAKTYRENDFNTPTHVNLAVQKKFQRYGWYTDIVSMDHYAAPSAPNVIPFTYIPFIGRMSEVEEAYAYSHSLKLNTEPRRNWSWVQFAGSVWDVQPEPISVNYQFWAHLAAGAKGMEWFVAQSGTIEEFPDQWKEGELLFKEFKQIRNACLYGEPSQIVSSSNSNVLTYALQGPEAIVVFAFNNSLEYGGNAGTGYTTDFSPQSYSLEVEVPSWFTYDDVYRVDTTGRRNDFSVSGSGTVTISPNNAVNDRMHVFVFSKTDTEAPKPLEGLNVSDYVDSINYTLSWKESFDNIGTAGYLVHYNGVQVADVKPPIFEVDSQSIACSGYYRITPYDNAGNLGLADSVQFILNGNAPNIIEQPANEIVQLGESASLSVEVSGVVGYQWQVSENGNWTNLIDSEDVFGSNSTTLTISGSAALDNVGEMYRCVITDPCGNELISDEVLVNVLSSIGEGHALHLKAYPNPSNGSITILFDDNSTGELAIFDAQGKLLKSVAVQSQSNHLSIDLSDQKSGIYLLRYLNENGELYVHRAILQH